MSKEKEEAGKKNTKNSKVSDKSKSFFTDERIKFVFGILITGFALYLLIACISYLFWWKTDLSTPDSEVISGPDIVVKNWSGKSGHFLAKTIIGYGFGYGAFFIPLIFGAIGLYLLNFPKIKLFKLIVKFAFAAIVISFLLSYLFGQSNGYLISGPGGAQGYIVTRWLNAFIGKIGTGVVVLFMAVTYLIYALKVKPETFGLRMPAFLKTMKLSTGTGEKSDGEDKLTEPNTEISEDDKTKTDSTDLKKFDFVVKNRTIISEPDDETEDEIEDDIP